MEVNYFPENRNKVCYFDQQKTKVDYFSFLPPELIVEITKKLNVLDCVSFSLTSTRHLKIIKTYSYSIIYLRSYTNIFIKRCSLSSIKNYFKYYADPLNKYTILVSCVNNDPNVLDFIISIFSEKHGKINTNSIIKNMLPEFICIAPPLQLQKVLTFANIKMSDIDIEHIFDHIISNMSHGFEEENINVIKNIDNILPFNMDKLSDELLFNSLICSSYYNQSILFEYLIDKFNLTFNEDTHMNGELVTTNYIKNYSRDSILYYIMTISIINKRVSAIEVILNKCKLTPNFIVRFLSSHLKSGKTWYSDPINLLKYYTDSSIEMSKEDVINSDILLSLESKIKKEGAYTHLSKNLKKIFKNLGITKEDVESSHIYFLKKIRKLVGMN